MRVEDNGWWLGFNIMLSMRVWVPTSLNDISDEGLGDDSVFRRLEREASKERPSKVRHKRSKHENEGERK